MKCSLKLRYVFEDKKCVLCKETLDDVVVTSNRAAKFEDLDLSRMKVDKRTGIRLDSDISYGVLDDLKLRCPVCVKTDTISRPFKNVRALKAHASKCHEGKLFCDLCLQHRKVFPHEQRLYTREELTIHMKRGDPPKNGHGALAPHPRCKFCRRKQFFDETMLAQHMREAHFQCHVCQRQNINEYFRNYGSLNRHFERDHFVCQHPSCKEQKFVVFGSRLEYNAHLVKVHEEKSARRLSPSMFFSSSSSNNNRRNNNRRASRNNERNVTASSITNLHAERQRVRGRDIMLRIRRAFEQMDRKNAERHIDMFRNFTSSFKTSKINSRTYIQRCFELFKNDSQLKSLFREFVNLIPDRVKANEIMRSMEAFRAADTRRRRLEDEFPELKKEDNAFRVEEECVAPVSTTTEHKATSKKIETDWDRLAHLQNCPRRLLVASRRAVYNLPENKRKKRRGRRPPEQQVLKLPKWASNHVKSFRQHRRDIKVTDFVPPLISGFSEDARSDWDTVLDLYVRVFEREIFERMC